MVYLWLFCAIAAEVAATSLLPRTAGFSHPVPTVVVLLCYGVSFTLVAHVVETMPVSIVYAIWSAVGTVAIAAIGAVFLGQSITVWQAIGMALVVAGMVLMNLGGPTTVG